MKKNKKAIKRVRRLHHPMNWNNHNSKEVCSECKVPYPCRTIEALNNNE
jgi:hypothetical protein